MVWVKLLHVATIALWSAGLLCLPGLYVQRSHVPAGPGLYRLQALVRFLYVGLMSPAAYLAIASGTLLIFLRGTWTPWFAMKLLFVGVLAAIHILTGAVIIRLFNEGEIYPVWRFFVVTVLTMATIVVILLLVLGKPEVPPVLPHWLQEPGALRRLVEQFNPFRRS